MQGNGLLENRGEQRHAAAAIGLAATSLEHPARRDNAIRIRAAHVADGISDVLGFDHVAVADDHKECLVFDSCFGSK